MDRPIDLSRQQASDYLQNEHGIKRSPQTLAGDAVRGTGPEFTYIGRFPRYSPPKLDAWVAARRSEPTRSSSKTAPQNADHGGAK